MQPQQQRPRTVAEINQTLDTLNENVLTWLQWINDRADRRGWSDGKVASGLRSIKKWQRRIRELEEERRALYAATTAQAS